MGYFTQDQADALAASTVRVATLVDLELDTPVYAWNGDATRTIDGNKYLGVGRLGSVQGLGETRGPVSKQIVLQLSAVDPQILALGLQDSSLVEDRLGVVSILLMDGEWQPVGGRIPLFFGLCEPPQIERSTAAMMTGATQTLSLPIENLLFGRGRPSNSRMVDRDQQRRFPGDRFFEYMASLVYKTIKWGTGG